MRLLLLQVNLLALLALLYDLGKLACGLRVLQLGLRSRLVWKVLALVRLSVGCKLLLWLILDVLWLGVAWRLPLGLMRLVLVVVLLLLLLSAVLTMQLGVH